MIGAWWRWPVATFSVFFAFLPATAADSRITFGLTDHPAGLAAINTLLVVGAIAILIGGLIDRNEHAP